MGPARRQGRQDPRGHPDGLRLAHLILRPPASLLACRPGLRLRASSSFEHISASPPLSDSGVAESLGRLMTLCRPQRCWQQLNARRVLGYAVPRPRPARKLTGHDRSTTLRRVQIAILRSPLARPLRQTAEEVSPPPKVSGILFRSAQRINVGPQSVFRSDQNNRPRPHFGLRLGRS